MTGEQMSAMTILVPADQVGPIRESLLARHGELVEEIERRENGGAQGISDERRGRLEGLEAVLGQIGWSPAEEAAPCSLTGPQPVLWSAVYDTMCIAAERLAEICEAYWREGMDGAEIRAAIADVAVRFDLLDSLGQAEGTARESSSGAT